MTMVTRQSRKLYKAPEEAMIAGVAAGVAKYFDVDTTLVRALWAASLLVGGFGFIAYVILWIGLENEPVPILPEAADEPHTDAAIETEQPAEAAHHVPIECIEV